MPKGVAGNRARSIRRAMETVERRIQRDSDRKDFLAYILAANDEKGMTRAEIHVNARALVVAGSETTATLLAGVTFYIVMLPIIYHKVVSEIHSAYKPEDEITLSSVHEVEYLIAVLSEALRL
jgi:cytochrome P450